MIFSLQFPIKLPQSLPSPKIQSPQSPASKAHHPSEQRNRKTHHTSIILKVQENPVRPSPRLALAHNNCRHDLLPQLRLALLDRRHDHITDTASRETVETRTDTFDGDDVEISGARVVAAIHHCAAAGVLALTHAAGFWQRR
jgi:hypothetical protein